MRKDLDQIAPRFVAMAHGIGMAVAATTGAGGDPHTRVMQPVWEWDGEALTGWASTSIPSPKFDDLAARPRLSLTYWHPEQDTCTFEGTVEVVTDPAGRAAAWERFLATPEPAGFDPAIHPDWDSPASPTFGVLRLTPTWLRVMPGTLFLKGEGEVWTWRS